MSVVSLADYNPDLDNNLITAELREIAMAMTRLMLKKKQEFVQLIQKPKECRNCLRLYTV